MYISTYKMYLLCVAKKSLALIFNPNFPSLHKLALTYHHHQGISIQSSTQSGVCVYGCL